MRDCAINLLQEYFGDSAIFKDTYYSFSYSQGDGAGIEFSINIKDLNKKYKIFSDEEVRFLTDKGVVNDIIVKHCGNFYYHKYAFKVDYDYYNDWDFEDIKGAYNISEDEFDSLEDRFYSLVNDNFKHYTKSPFISDIINMNTKLEKDGYSFIEYECDNDVIIEVLSNHEYYKNGSLYDSEV